MEWNWEIHKPDHGLNQRDRIRVTINKTGTVYMNAAAHKALGHPEAVVMMYDRRLKTIGVTSASANRKEAYRLKRKGVEASNGRLVYARTFCRDFNIYPSETLVFADAMINKDGVLILDLNAVRPAPRKRLAKKV